jgi:TPR repeat protein
LRAGIPESEAAAAFKQAKALWSPGREASRADRKAALARYRIAASSGVAEYKCALGEILVIEGDFRAGYRCILDAAKLGFAPAQYWIARELAIGENVRRNSKAAAEWYRKASRRGDAQARYNLGTMYFGGEGVPRDPARGDAGSCAPRMAERYWPSCCWPTRIELVKWDSESTQRVRRIGNGG